MRAAASTGALEAKCIGEFLACKPFNDREGRRDLVNVELLVRNTR